jgi:diguanylate cyclase (GGDEF)-like protein
MFTLMTMTSPSGPGALPGAALGPLLQHTDAAKRFDPELEAEYVRTRLLHDRTLIRMACLLALATTVLRLGEVAVRGSAMPVPSLWLMIFFPLVVLLSSVLLTWLAWGPGFVRRYLPTANFAVPVRSVFAAVALGALATHGEVDLLIVLPAMVLSPFFFLGLHFRPALACVALTIVAFAISALVFGMPAPVLLRSCIFLIITAATSAVAAWQLERQSRRSFLERRFIAQLAEHDALTGAKNRRVFDEHLARLWQQAIRDGRQIATLLIDVDHFKAYNDRYGHQAGDIALQQVAQAVHTQIKRPLDLLSRYGGEEFAVLLYDIDGHSARAIAEQMRLAVSALGIEHRGSRAERVVTVSIGVSAVQPLAERGPHGALQLADEALYAAKARGRNKVHLAAESDYGDLQTGIFAHHAASG